LNYYQESLERKEKEDLRLKTAFEVNGIKIKQNVLGRTKLLVDRLKLPFDCVQEKSKY